MQKQFCINQYVIAKCKLNYHNLEENIFNIARDWHYSVSLRDKRRTIVCKSSWKYEPRRGWALLDKTYQTTYANSVV